MKAVIMAGGRGSRIQGVCSDRPKPMMTVCGKPILEMQVENLVACGITSIIVVTGYMGQVITDYFGDGNQWGCRISYYEEDAEKPLGTAGALFLMSELNEDFILMCGDLVCDIDFNRMIAFHKRKKEEALANLCPLATLLVHPNNHPYDSALIETERVLSETGGIPRDTGRVTAWRGRGRDGTLEVQDGIYYRNLVNSGIEIITPELLEMTREILPSLRDRWLSADCEAIGASKPPHMTSQNTSLKVDLDRDVLRRVVGTGRIYAYRTTEYICDMGTPERYARVERDVNSGIVSARNLRRPQRAVFMDRDDTIVHDAHFMHSPEQLELLPGAAEAIKRINEAGYLAVVITNQPVIARGEATWEDLENIHAKLETLLGECGAYLDGIYVCPHHPDKGFKGERAEYKKVCECRKPQPGLILQAAHDMNIDVGQSIMIGDRPKDAECGRRAGCKQSIQLHEGYTLLNAVKEVVG